MKTRFILISGIAALLTSCDVISTATGINVSMDWKSRINNIPEFPEKNINLKEVVSTTTNSNFSTSVTNAASDTIEVTNWVSKTVKYSATDNPDKFIMYNPQASVLWPGNLVQGNSLASGIPSTIPVYKRKPMTVVLDGISGTTNSKSETVTNPSMAGVYQAMNNILVRNQITASAGLSYSFSDAYSANQLQIDLGLGYSGGAVTFNNQLGIKWEESKHRIAVKLIQQFFTMTYEDQQGMDGVFDTNFTLTDIDPYINSGNPPCYISSVTYGRILFVVYESSGELFELTNFLHFAYGKGVSVTADVKLKYSQIMQNTSVKVFMMGGDPVTSFQMANPTTFTNIDTIRDNIINGASFSYSNIGVPISYTVRYLKNAKLVRMNNTTEYTVDQLEAVNVTSMKKLSRFSISLDQIKCLYRGTASTFIGKIELFVNKENGEADYQYNLPYISNVNYWQTGQTLNIYSNFPYITVTNSTDNFIKSRFTVFQLAGSVNDTNTSSSFYGMSEGRWSYSTNTKSWSGDILNKTVNFYNGLSVSQGASSAFSNSLSAAFSISTLP